MFFSHLVAVLLTSRWRPDAARVQADLPRHLQPAARGLQEVSWHGWHGCFSRLCGHEAAGCKANVSLGIHILYNGGTHLGVDLSWQLAQVAETRLLDEPVLDLKQG